jgi:hypothetical protein
MSEIRLSPAAEAHLRALEAFYIEKNRPAAILKLFSNLEYVSNPENLIKFHFFEFPRPYPKIKIPRVTWLNYNNYWFGFDVNNPMQIVASIHGSASFTRQTRHLRSPAKP